MTTQRPVPNFPPSIVQAPPLAEDGLALAFTRDWADYLRYTAKWGRWNMWNGSYWESDDTNIVFDLVRKSCRRATAHCQTEKDEFRIASAATISAVERLAAADRRHAATVDQWDADLWILNTPDGVIDLRSGNLLPAKPEDYCTKITAVSPGGECPLWKKFLSRVTDQNKELEQFLQRMVGYSLTGITREHAWFFLYGTGANGKSVFMNTISGLLSNYAKPAAIETFTSSPFDQHPTDLAWLQGARFVTATETESYRAWAEAKIKRLTGGDPIPARFMRQDYFQYIPQFKLVIAGNNKPTLRTNDEATRRRINLVPFTVTIPPAERDPELANKLQVEWGGILGWALEGCREWQLQGLNAPAIVRGATEEYLAAEDTLGQWLEECCNVGPELSSTVAELFRSWHSWWTQRGEEEIPYTNKSCKWFSQELEKRGMVRDRTSTERIFRGLSLKPNEAP